MQIALVTSQIYLQDLYLDYHKVSTGTHLMSNKKTFRKFQYNKFKKQINLQIKFKYNLNKVYHYFYKPILLLHYTKLIISLLHEYHKTKAPGIPANFFLWYYVNLSEWIKFYFPEILRRP